MAYVTKKELVEKLQPLGDRLRRVQANLEELTEGSPDEELVETVDRLSQVLDELEEVLSEASED